MSQQRESMTDDDAYAKRELVFPQLAIEMVDRSLRYGAIEHYSAGSTLYARGLRGVDFLIVLRGSVLITGLAEGGGESVITIHTEREFTGEMDLFSYREALVTARAATDTDVLRIGRDRFKEYVSSETEISDIAMRAVILRRMGLIQHSRWSRGNRFRAVRRYAAHPAISFTKWLSLPINRSSSRSICGRPGPVLWTQSVRHASRDFQHESL